MGRGRKFSEFEEFEGFKEIKEFMEFKDFRDGGTKEAPQNLARPHSYYISQSLLLHGNDGGL